jgi:hypothetical protein
MEGDRLSILAALKSAADKAHNDWMCARVLLQQETGEPVDDPRFQTPQASLNRPASSPVSVPTSTKRPVSWSIKNWFTKAPARAAVPLADRGASKNLGGGFILKSKQAAENTAVAEAVEAVAARSPGAGLLVQLPRLRSQQQRGGRPRKPIGVAKCKYKACTSRQKVSWCAWMQDEFNKGHIYKYIYIYVYIIIHIYI